MTNTLLVFVVVLLILCAVLVTYNVVEDRQRRQVPGATLSVEETVSDLRAAVADLTAAARKAREAADRLDNPPRRKPPSKETP